MTEFSEERLVTDNILSDIVVTKYKQASDICNNVLKRVAAACVAGASVTDICRQGDSWISEQTVKVFKGVERGIAFPTTININDIAQNFSPSTSAASPLLAALDVVNIELGVHIDGYIATSAHTIVVRTTEIPQSPLTGRPADAICAAYYASEVALRMLKPGVRSVDIKNAIQRVAASFRCQPCEGTGSYNMRRYIIEGDTVIPNEPYSVLPRALPSTDLVLAYEADSPDNFTIQANQVYAINVYISSGTGILRDSPHHEIGVYQRDVNNSYKLKLKSARLALSTSLKHFSVFPFATRGLVDIDPAVRLGIPECKNFGQFVPLPITEDHSVDVNGNRAVVAQFKITVLITGNGTVMRVSAGDDLIALPYCHSNYSLGPEFLEIMQTKVRGVKTIGGEAVDDQMEMDM